MSEDPIPAEIGAFRRARLEAVTAPTGDAALIGTFWITEPTELDGFPGSWAPNAAGPTGLRYVAPDDGTVTAEVAPVAGPCLVAPASQGGAVLRHGPSRRATVLHWPGLGTAVRIWDAAEPAAAGIAAIENYPYDAGWRIEGPYTPHERTVDYAYHGHGGRLEGRHVVGAIALTIEDRDAVLLVTRNASGLTAVFGDATNGRETYGGGRFVAVTEAQGGRAVVDFNMATLPPCAFSPHFDCPLPPPQNVIKGPVRAGEKRILRR